MKEGHESGRYRNSVGKEETRGREKEAKRVIDGCMGRGERPI